MTPLVRLPDWNTRYVAFIARMRREAFSWQNASDCGVRWVGGAIEALTGVQVIDPPKYTTAAGAIRFMKRHGVDNAADFVALYLPEIPEGPCFARIGDIVAIPDDTAFGFALGIVNGERIFTRREDGIGTVDLLSAKRAFRV